MICINPEVGHLYGTEGGGLWEEFYLVFNGPVFDLLRKRTYGERWLAVACGKCEGLQKEL
ncbi:hypothetical protein [Rubritalea tangerina]|uniref:hypothetical protein n=1 Tax=Rubritalea tangerina TaxID=430798 RepID=UPI0036202682